MQSPKIFDSKDAMHELNRATAAGLKLNRSQRFEVMVE